MNLRQALHQEIHVSRQQSQELSTQYRNQAWRAVSWQQERFHETAQRDEQVSEDVTEAAVIRERAVQRAAQNQQLHGYRVVLQEVENQVHQNECMLHQAQHAQAEALQGRYSNALAEQQAALVHAAENALIQEPMKRKQLKAEYLRTLAQTQETADESLQQAQNAIHGLHGTLHQQDHSQANLHYRVQEMQIAMDNQRIHLNMELDTVQKRYDAHIQQIQAQQAQSAQ